METNFTYYHDGKYYDWVKRQTLFENLQGKHLFVQSLDLRGRQVDLKADKLSFKFFPHLTVGS